MSDRHEQIFEAALELISERGYDATTVDAIAQRAHVSKATIYRRWSDKSELAGDALLARVTRQPDTEPTETLRDDLLVAVRSMRDGLAEQDGPLVVGLLSAARTDQRIGEIVREQLIAAKASRIATPVQSAVARGSLPPSADPTLAAEVAGAVVLARVLITGTPLDDTEVERLVDEVLLPTLGAGDQT